MDDRKAVLLKPGYLIFSYTGGKHNPQVMYYWVFVISFLSGRLKWIDLIQDL